MTQSRAVTDRSLSKVVAFTIEELSVGGAERMLITTANQFVQLGWTVHMVCLKDAGELASELDASVHLHVLNKRRGLDVTLPYKLFCCIRKINPMCINSHLWVANAWTRIALFFTGRCVVATEHSRDTWKPWQYRWIDRLLAKRTAALVCVSADTANFYREIIGLDDAMMRVINNGVDTQRYAQGEGTALRQQWLNAAPLDDGIPTDKQIVIGTVGRLVPAKNHRRLIDAMSLLLNDDALRGYLLKLIVVGDGTERVDIEHYATEKGLGNTVIFTGSRHDIPDVLAAFDLFVLSSDREGHPLTALEAQAAGTPVVLTDAGGAGEAIARLDDEVGGDLVDKTADAIARALREMILKPDLRIRRADFAQKFALANFDQRHMAARYAALFDLVKR